MDPIPAEAWTKYGVVLSNDLDWLSAESSIQEPSLVHDADGWHLWYTGFPLGDNGRLGIGYATGPTALGPWTNYVIPSLPGVTILNASFETDVAPANGLADGWTIETNAAGAPTCTIVAGHSGNCQRIQYSAQAGDAGKRFFLVQSITRAFAPNETVVPFAWFKGSVAGATVRMNPVLMPSASEAMGVAAVVPTGTWAGFQGYPAFVMGDADTSVQLRIARVDITADNAVIDLYVDDVVLVHGITNPVKPLADRAHVSKVGDTFHMFYKDTSSIGGNIMQCSSPDGHTWSAGVLAVAKGAEDEWDHQPESSFPFRDDNGLWYLYYESTETAAGFPSGTGVAWATSILGPWTKYIMNPILDDMLRPSVFKTGGLYYMYGHSMGGYVLPVSAGESEPVRAVGTTPFNFVFDQLPIFHRTGADEGEGTNIGQAADVRVVKDANRYVMYYSATSNANVTLAVSYTKAAIAPMVEGGGLSLPAAAVATLCDISMVAGDTAPLLLTLPCDLTGCVTTWGFAAHSGGPLLFSHEVDLVDAPSGTVSVPLLTTDTAGLSGCYYHEAEVVDSVGGIKTLLFGRLHVRPDTV